MAADNKINVKISNIPSGNQSITSLKASAAPAFGTVDVKANNAKQELLKRLGITEEQLAQILSKRADFYSLSPEEQAKIVTGFNASVAESENNEVETADKKTIAVNNTKDSISTKAIVKEKLENEVDFDNKAFEAASLVEKSDIYAEELAKNKFIHADSKKVKSQEEWDALPKDKKQELIKAALNNSIKKNGKEVFDKKEADMLLQYNMTKVQAANAKNISVDDMDAKGFAYTEQAVHEYIVDNLYENTRTAGQEKYVKEQAFKSELLIEYSKKHGKASDWGDGTFILSPNEIKQHCKEMGVTIQEIQKQYLEDKKQKLGLSKDEEDKLSNLKNLDSLIQEVKDKTKNGPVDFGRMKEFEGSEYGKLYKTAQGTDEKLAITIKYLKDKNAGFEFSTEFISELVQNDLELAAVLHGEFITNSTPSDKKKIAANLKGFNQELNAYNINKFDAKSAKIAAETQKNIAKTDAKRADILAQLTLDRADGEHLCATSATYSSFGLDSVEKKHVKVALDKTRVNEEQQLEMLNNTYQNSGIEARKYAGVNNYQAYEENQLPLHNKAIQDKDVNDAMVEAGTYSKYSSKNQTAAFNAHKQRYEQNDYSEKEAIAGLNKLSDYIYKCDKNNQLEMHNEIMNTKYSEVQEHVAGNIKNYDSTVQTKALDAKAQVEVHNSVSSSGNATNSVNNFTNPIQYQGVQNLSENTQQVYNYLSMISSEGKPISRDVVVKMFQKLELNEQRDFLKSLSPQQVAQIPISVCNSFPELIETFVDMGKGVEIIQQCNIGTGNKTIQLMAKSKGAAKKQFNDWAANHTDRLAKCTYDAMVESGAIKINKSRTFTYKG